MVCIRSLLQNRWSKGTLWLAASLAALTAAALLGAVQENHDEDPEVRVLSSAEGPAAIAAKKGILASRQVHTFVCGDGSSFQSS